MKLNKLVASVKSLSLNIWKNKLSRNFFFTAVTLITILLMGYHFGTFDQAIHIPYLKKFADPGLYPNDPFLKLRFLHYSFFWFFFIPFYKLGVLEISMFIIYFIIVYLTFWSIYNLSKKLFNNPITAFLTVIAFIIPHIGFAGFPLFEFSLLNRTFVLPFLIIAINLYLDNKNSTAFILLGIMANLHIISVIFVLFMFIMDIIIRRRHNWQTDLFTKLFIFILTASPLLIWKLTNTADKSAINPEWFTVISHALLYHLFYFFGQNLYIALLTIGGLSITVLFFIAKSGLKKSENNCVITNFVFAVLIILAVQLSATYFYPLTVIIQLQIIRAGVFLLLFGYLFFIQYLVELLKSGKINEATFISLFFLILFSFSPAFFLLIWFFYRFIPSKYLPIFTIFIIMFIILFSFPLVRKINVWSPGIYIFPQKTSEYSIQLWARNNTPENALFITPPHQWWFYNLEWRVISERSTLVTLSDILEVAFAPDYLPIWKERFESIAPNALKYFKGNVFTNFKITKKAFYSNSAKDFKRIADKYHITYLVIEKPYHYNFPKVYENNGFIIYKIK